MPVTEYISATVIKGMSYDCPPRPSESGPLIKIKSVASKPGLHVPCQLGRTQSVSLSSTKEKRPRDHVTGIPHSHAKDSRASNIPNSACTVNTCASPLHRATRCLQAEKCKISLHNYIHLWAHFYVSFVWSVFNKKKLQF